MAASPSSRFEELPDDEPTPSTSSPTPPAPAPVVLATPEPPTSSSADDGSDDDSDEEDNWWTPSELRVRPSLSHVPLELPDTAVPELTLVRSRLSPFPPRPRPLRTQDLLDRAQALKQRGNTEFGQGRWSFALETYREGLAELPVRRRSVKGKEKALPEEQDVSDQGRAVSASVREGEVDEAAELDELSELRAILSANIAACLLKLVRLFFLRMLASLLTH